MDRVAADARSDHRWHLAVTQAVKRLVKLIATALLMLCVLVATLPMALQMRDSPVDLNLDSSSATSFFSMNPRQFCMMLERWEMGTVLVDTAWFKASLGGHPPGGDTRPKIIFLRLNLERTLDKRRWKMSGEATAARKGHRSLSEAMTKKRSSDFFKKEWGDTHQLPPRVTPIQWRHWCFFLIFRFENLTRCVPVTKLCVKVYILSFNSCIKFHSEICTQCWNVNKSWKDSVPHVRTKRQACCSFINYSLKYYQWQLFIFVPLIIAVRIFVLYLMSMCST